MNIHGKPNKLPLTRHAVVRTLSTLYPEECYANDSKVAEQHPDYTNLTSIKELSTLADYIKRNPVKNFIDFSAYLYALKEIIVANPDKKMVKKMHRLRHVPVETAIYKSALNAIMDAGLPVKDRQDLAITIVFKSKAVDFSATDLSFTDKDKQALATSLIDTAHNVVFKQVFKNYTVKNISDLLDCIWYLGYGEDLYQTVDDNTSLLPIEIKRQIRRHYKNWIQATEVVENITDQSVVDNQPQEPEKLHPAIIYVDHQLLEEGDRDMRGMIDYELANGVTSSYYDEPRIDWLLDALAQNGVDIVSDTIIYKEKITDEEARRRRAYEVLEVINADIQVQIAVCPTKGNATFVLKDTDKYQFDGGKPIEIGTLRDDPHAFIVKCFSADQWTRQIIELAKADKDDLQEQLKHNTYWKPLYCEAVQSFAAYVLETGRLPSTQDRSIISHGPLANKSTFSRLYGALHSGSIPELREAGVKSFTQLKEHIAEYHPELLMKPKADIAPMPEQPDERISFEKPAEQLQSASKEIGLPTSVIFHAAAQFIMANDRALKPDDTLNLGAHGNIEAKDISAVIELGEAYNMHRFVPAGIKPPRDLQEFTLLSGLTRIEAGQIVAADKAVIQGLIKTYG